MAKYKPTNSADFETQKIHKKSIGYFKASGADIQGQGNTDILFPPTLDRFWSFKWDIT